MTETATRPLRAVFCRECGDPTGEFTLRGGNRGTCRVCLRLNEEPEATDNAQCSGCGNNTFILHASVNVTAMAEVIGQGEVERYGGWEINISPETHDRITCANCGSENIINLEAVYT